jgi:hypothetical protein
VLPLREQDFDRLLACSRATLISADCDDSSPLLIVAAHLMTDSITAAMSASSVTLVNSFTKSALVLLDPTITCGATGWELALALPLD